MPSSVPTAAMLAGAMSVTGSSSTTTPTSFQLSRSVKPEYVRVRVRGAGGEAGRQ